MKNFAMGFITANTVERLVWAWALSNTDMGDRLLRNIIAKLDHDKLLRVSEALDNEIMRRKHP